jgi:tetratricopeptide (TPR) repeat protein
LAEARGDGKDECGGGLIWSIHHRRVRTLGTHILGCFMNFVATSSKAVGLLALLLLSVGGSAAAEDCQLKRAASFPIVNDPSRGIRVPVVINGTKDTNLLLETGSFASMLREDVVKELGLKETTSSVTATGFRGTAIDKRVTLNTLQLGNLKARAPEFLVDPEIDNYSSDISGLFGANFLSSYDLDLDFGQMKASLFSQDHCKGKVVYWSDSYFSEPITLVERFVIMHPKLNGQTIRAVLSTGSSATVLSQDAAASLLDLKPGDPRMVERGSTVTADGVKHKRYETQLETLEFAGVTFRNTQIVIEPANFLPEGADMVLGTPQLRKLHLYIAYGEKKLYATPVEPADLERRDAEDRDVSLCRGSDPKEPARSVPVNEKLNACAAVIGSPTQPPFARVAAFVDRGYAYRLKGDLDHAIADEDQAIALDPNSWAAFWNRALILQVKQSHEAALRDLDHAITLNPKAAVLYNTRGVSRAAMDDQEQAVADFSQAITLDPKFVRAIVRRGFAYHHLGADDRALADFDQAIALDPKDSTAWNDRCLVRAVTGALDQAASDCEEAVRLAPENAGALDTRAFVLLQSGQLDRAIADYGKALAINPALAASLYGRSLAKARKGDKKGAAADLAAALALNPDIAASFARDP